MTAQDPEHAGHLMYEWKYHENSNNPNVGKEKDLIKTNKECVKNLLHTARDFSGFRQSATSYKQPKEGTKNMNIKLPEEGHTYGKPLEYFLPNNLGMKIQLRWLLLMSKNQIARFRLEVPRARWEALGFFKN